MADLKLTAYRDGTDLELIGVDLVSIDGFQNMPLLGLYGGNFEESTKVFNLAELRSDWWGNEMLDFDNPSVQMNSKLERTLINTALNSAGRIEIEETVKKDLEFMTTFGDLEVTVSIVDVDRISIYIKITEPSNEESNEFTFIWNATEKELKEI